MFKIQRFKEPVQIATGLAAGLIRYARVLFSFVVVLMLMRGRSTSQLFRKEEVRLFKALH